MRSLRLLSLAGMLMLASFASPLFAASSPESVVTEYMGALKTEGMAAVSRFIHPDEQKRFKEMLMPMLRKDAAAKSEVIHGLFGAEATLTSVEAMAPAEVMDGIMRVAGTMLPDMKFGESEILGKVREKEVVHVVVRMVVLAKGVQIKKMTVVSTRQAGPEWKLMLSGELESLAAALSAQ